MRLKGFIGPSYTLNSRSVDCQRCINLYPEMDEIGTGKAGEVASLVSTPGLNLLVNLGAGPIRGVYESTLGNLYVVSGNQIYSISPTWVATSIGTLNSSLGPISFADNGSQMVFVDGNNGYVVALPNGAPASVVIQDILYMAVTNGTGGNGINIQYIGGGVAAAEIVTVSGQAITVQIQQSVSTADNIVFAIAASAAATALVTPTVSGVDSNPQTIVAATNLTNGLNAGGFYQITDPNFLGANMVTFQDGYFLFNKPGTNQFYYSGIDQVTFDPLDYASKEGEADVLVSIVSDHRDVWLCGSQSIEVWYDSGDALNPFQRVQGAFIEYGVAAAFTFLKLNNTVYWLGCDDKGTGIVFMANGYMPQRISTHAVENAIRGYGDVSAASAYSYQENGHYFYVLNFPNADTTWVFDSTTNLWHERNYTDQGQFERHRADNHAFAYGAHVVGDYENGNIYQMSSDVYSDNGNPITRLRRTPHIVDADALDFITYSSFQLDMEVGVGLDGTGQGTNPKVMLRFSNDGGYRWSNEVWADAGKIGQRKARARWRRLGHSRDRVFEVKITDPIKVVLIGADIEMMKESA